MPYFAIFAIFVNHNERGKRKYRKQEVIPARNPAYGDGCGWVCGKNQGKDCRRNLPYVKYTQETEKQAYRRNMQKDIVQMRKEPSSGKAVKQRVPHK